jgi:enolase
MIVGWPPAVGDEGGFAPKFESADDALETDRQGRQESRLQSWARKSSSRWMWRLRSFTTRKKKQYVFKKSDKSRRNASELIAYYKELTKKFPIISIEDGCSENDWTGWKRIDRRAWQRMTKLVGDDLLVTNVEFSA